MFTSVLDYVIRDSFEDILFVQRVPKLFETMQEMVSNVEAMEICQGSGTDEDGQKNLQRSGAGLPGQVLHGRGRARGRGRGYMNVDNPAVESPSSENRISSCRRPGENLQQGAAGGAVVSRSRGRGRKKPDQVLYVPRALRGRNEPKTSEPKIVDRPETNMMKPSTLRENSSEQECKVVQSTASAGKDSSMDGQQLPISGGQKFGDEQLQTGKDCVRDDEQLPHLDATCRSSDGDECTASGMDFECPHFTAQDAIEGKNCTEKNVVVGLAISDTAVEPDHADSKGENTNMRCEESERSQRNIITSEDAAKDPGRFEEHSSSSDDHRHKIQECYSSDVQVKCAEDNSMISQKTDSCDCESSLFLLSDNCLSESADFPDDGINLHNTQEVKESTAGVKTEPITAGDGVSADSIDVLQGKDATKMSSVECEEQKPKRSLSPDKLEESTQSGACMDHEEVRILSAQPDSGSKDNLQMTLGINDKESPVIDSVVSEKEPSSSNSGKQDLSKSQISMEQGPDDNSSEMHAAEESNCNTETKTSEKAKKRKSRKADEKESRKKSRSKEEKKKKKKGTKEEDSRALDGAPKHSKHTIQSEQGSAGNSKEHMQSKPACKTGNEESGQGSDDWDANFNDDGECLNPELLKQLHIATGIDKPIVQKPCYDYYNWTPTQAEVDEPEYEHIVEIYGFSSELKTQDLSMAFSPFREAGFDIKWVDDTHALGVFTSKIAANQAIELCSSPLLKVRPLSEGIPESKRKARTCLEFLQPYKERPQTTKIAANRLISGALGIKSKMTREERQKEREKLKEAKEQKRKKQQQKADVWGD